MKHIMFIALAALALPSLANAASLPAGTKPVPAADLKTMLAGKTQDGIMYFGIDGKFVAVGAGGTTTSEAPSGTWSAADTGRVCMDTVYSSLGNLILKEPGIRTVQCWDYQQGGGALYQRRARNPSNGLSMLGLETSPVDPTATDWTVFKNAKPDPKDPINNVVSGDQATAKVKNFGALVTLAAPDMTKYGQKLSGDAIKAALFGHTSTNAANAQFTIVVAGDGSTTLNAPGAPSTGVSRVVNDLYCIHSPLDQVERCFWIVSVR